MSSPMISKTVSSIVGFPFLLGVLRVQECPISDPVIVSNTISDPVIYLRYVYDVFCIFRKGVDFHTFLDTLNSLHANLRFTYEYGGSEIPFLDTNIKLTSGGIKTTVFRKKTDTGVILNESAVTPPQWKKSLVSCFLHRATIVCSDQDSLEKEIRKLRQTFEQNNYNVNFFDKETNKYFERKLQKKISEQEVEKTTTPNKRKAWIKLPYIGKPSVHLGKRLQTLLHRQMDTDLRVTYGTTKIKDSFRLKDRDAPEICTQVVYKFTCPGDPDITYIGFTNRSLRERVAEHLNIKKCTTAVSDHISQCKTCCENGVSINDFKILRQCQQKWDTPVHEALLIKKENPRLNRQSLKSSRYSFTLRVFN